MSTTAGRVFTGMTRAAFSRAIFIHDATKTARLNNVRSLALSSQSSSKSTEDKVRNNEPIKFSTSKASHRTWKVDQSMGSQFQQPWKKVLSICLVLTGILLWSVLRDETDIDRQLEQQLHEHLPDLFSEEEEDEQNQTKSS